jgi:hypothetical protein
VLAALRASPGITESYLYLAGLVAMTVGIRAAVSRLVRRRNNSSGDAAAVIVVWWLLACVTSAIAPGFSYLFAWPALAGALVLLWTSWITGSSRPWPALTGFALVAGTTLILLVPPIDTFYQLVQPRPGNPDSELLHLIALPIVLVVLVVELIGGFRRAAVQAASEPGRSTHL